MAHGVQRASLGLISGAPSGGTSTSSPYAVTITTSNLSGSAKDSTMVITVLGAEDYSGWTNNKRLTLNTTASAANEAATKLPEFKVSSEKDTSFVGKQALSTTRIGVDLGDLAQSVVVLNKMFLDSASPSIMAKSLNYVGGAQTGTWRVRVHTDPKAEAISSAAFLVEDFVPERLEMKLEPIQQSMNQLEKLKESLIMIQSSTITATTILFYRTGKE